jgi:two-component system, response regulator PdtaR
MPLRILLVEDEAILALAFVGVLEDMGHIVCAIEFTEAAAVSAALRLKPDLMIVDAGLGEGDGVIAVDAILQSFYIPHIFISGDHKGARA